MNATQILFIAFVLAMAAIVVAVVFRYLGPRRAAGTSVALAVWFAYVAALSHFGVLRRTDSLPPGMVFILGPVAVYLVVATLFSMTARGRKIASAVPMTLVIALQAFRVVVELFIHRIWRDGVVPEMLTFGGANVDIYIGLSAPIVALLVAKTRKGNTIDLVWNVLGLLVLANVVARAILSAPGPLNFIHTDPPNRMFVTFPFIFIPAFFVPLAMTLHILAIRGGWMRLKDTPHGDVSL